MNLRRRVLTLGIIGLCVTAVTIGLAVRFPYQTYVVQVAASDWAMVSADGLRLGARPVREDISLVLFDVRSATEIGFVRTFDEDISLYEELFNSGAKLVYDTRSVAAADQTNFEQIEPLLDGMTALRDDGSLLRDAYLGAEILAANHPRYTSIMAQNLVNSHPHVMPSLRSRLYPMFHVTSIGMWESAPLMIARYAWGGSRADHDTVSENMRQAGVLTAWHAQAPDVAPESDAERTAYPLGEHAVEWYPFPTSTVLVPPAGYWVSYDPDVDAYRRHSYIDVLQSTEPLDFQDQIVLIGYSPETDILTDSYEVPSVQRKAAPVEVAAAAVQTLLDQRQMHVPAVGWQFGLIGLMCVGLSIVGGLLRPLQAVAVLVSLLLAYFATAVAGYRLGWYTDFALIPIAGVVSGGTGLVFGAWLNVRARQRIVDLFGRYVPRAVVNQLMLKPQLRSLAMGGVKQEVSVMFADIRGFTSFSEELPPEQVVLELNSLLEIMVECTFEHEGTLDKFIGDAILVLFNAPLEQSDHEIRAVQTAIDIQRRLIGHPTGLSVGIGLHRGEAVVGNIGTPKRLEYTAIGSTVNIASRLCGVAKPGEVIVSSGILNACGDRFKTHALGPVTVKGLNNPVEAHRVELPKPED